MIIIYKCYFNVNWLYFIEQYKSNQFNSIQFKKKGYHKGYCFIYFLDLILSESGLLLLLWVDNRSKLFCSLLHKEINIMIVFLLCLDYKDASIILY